MLVFPQRCWLNWLQKPLIYSQSCRVRKIFIFYIYILYKTMYTSGKKKEKAFFVKTKYKGKIEFGNLESSHLWNPKSTNGESGIHRQGIRNPQTGNPESTDRESGVHSVESGIQDSLGLPYMGRNMSLQFSDISFSPPWYIVYIQRDAAA